MTQVGQDTLGTRSTLSVGGTDYAYYALSKATRGVELRSPSGRQAQPERDEGVTLCPLRLSSAHPELVEGSKPPR